MKVKEVISKVGFSLKKHSPEILMAAGIVGTVASAVMACKATTKLDVVLNETKEQLDQIHKHSEKADKQSEEDTKKEKKDTVIVYAHTGKELAKLYVPAVSLGALSLCSILASNKILKQRNVALTAGLAAANRAFKEYRGRVVEQFGEEVDQQLRYNIKSAKIEETVTDEKGKEKKVKKTIEVADPDASGYLKYFTQTNPYWENNPEYVEMFLRAQQNYANDKLRAVGHLTLNEVYNMLGMQDSKAGMVVGWIYDTHHPNGDNFVEFDVKKVYLPNEGGDYEEAYAIDFNVDGNIYDKMI